MRLPSRRLVLALALPLALAGCHRTQPELAAPAGAWVGSWSAAPQLTEPRNMPPAPGLAGNTLRQVVHVTLGGERLRVRFSNEFGNGPLELTAARLAVSAGGSAIEAATAVPLTFGGQPGVTIPPGEARFSDPLAFQVRPLSNLAITLHFGAVPPELTGHPGSRTTSYIQPGDAVAAAELPGAVRTEHWYAISGIELARPGRAVVVLGNSIADGRGSGTDKDDRWPDNLARRLLADPRTAAIAVLNQGIGGNTILRGGLGPTALARFDRDVLGQSGVRWLIVSEGVNDIGTARGPAASDSVATQLIAAYQHMIAAAHARRIRVYGATILPFGRSFYSSPEHEAARAAVNRWIRAGGQFDAVVDLDAAMRDPTDPTRLRADLDSGDHLHPNEAGYRVMADAFDLTLFTK